MVNAFVEFVKQYRKENPSLSYKEAMVKASKIYKKDDKKPKKKGGSLDEAGVKPLIGGDAGEYKGGSLEDKRTRNKLIKSYKKLLLSLEADLKDGRRDADLVKQFKDVANKLRGNSQTNTYAKAIKRIEKKMKTKAFEKKENNLKKRNEKLDKIKELQKSKNTMDVDEKSYKKQQERLQRARKRTAELIRRKKQEFKEGKINDQQLSDYIKNVQKVVEDEERKMEENEKALEKINAQIATNLNTIQSNSTGLTYQQFVKNYAKNQGINYRKAQTQVKSKGLWSKSVSKGLPKVSPAVASKVKPSITLSLLEKEEKEEKKKDIAVVNKKLEDFVNKFKGIKGDALLKLIQDGKRPNKAQVKKTFNQVLKFLSDEPNNDDLKEILNEVKEVDTNYRTLLLKRAVEKKKEEKAKAKDDKEEKAKAKAKAEEEKAKAKEEKAKAKAKAEEEKEKAKVEETKEKIREKVKAKAKTEGKKPKKSKAKAKAKEEPLPALPKEEEEKLLSPAVRPKESVDFSDSLAEALSEFMEEMGNIYNEIFERSEDEIEAYMAVKDFISTTMKEKKFKGNFGTIDLSKLGTEEQINEFLQNELNLVDEDLNKLLEGDETSGKGFKGKGFQKDLDGGNLSDSISNALSKGNLVDNIDGEDDKYFKASVGSYKKPDKRKDLGKFRYDKDLSDNENAVYVNDEDKKVIVAFRGSVNKKDLMTDLKLAVGGIKNTERYGDTINLVRKVIDMYPDYKIEFTGHSLGGTLAIEMNLISPTKKAVVFNAGHTPLRKKATHINDIRYYTTKGDVVSNLGLNSYKDVRIMKGNLQNPIKAHSLSNFKPLEDDKNDFQGAGFNVVSFGKKVVKTVGSIGEIKKKLNKIKSKDTGVLEKLKLAKEVFEHADEITDGKLKEYLQMVASN